MPDVERLFIGGPLDGQRRLVGDERLCFVTSAAEGSVLVLYRLELVIDPAREPLCVFALDGTGRGELLGRLQDPGTSPGAADAPSFAPRGAGDA